MHVLPGKRNIFARLSEDEFMFCARRSAKETSIMILPGRRTLRRDALHVMLLFFFAGHIVQENVQIPSGGGSL